MNAIVHGTSALRGVRQVHLETRPEYVDTDGLKAVAANNKRAKYSLIIGFETLDETIRQEILQKRQPLTTFESCLAAMGEANYDLVAYVLYKSHPDMDDQAASAEAEASVDYLVEASRRAGVDVIVRLNPMYIAKGSKWDREGRRETFVPPDLRDVFRLGVKKRREGVKVYLGLSEEGLSQAGTTFVERKHYSPRVLQRCIQFNEDPGYLPDEG